MHALPGSQPAASAGQDQAITATHTAAADRCAAAILSVVETFHSLQSEELHAGRSAVFVRLAGCAVCRPWCGSRHSCESEAHPRRALTELAAEVAAAASAAASFAVITGGEPLEQDLGSLRTGRSRPTECRCRSERRSCRSAVHSSIGSVLLWLTNSRSTGSRCSPSASGSAPGRAGAGATTTDRNGLTAAELTASRV